MRQLQLTHRLRSPYGKGSLRSLRRSLLGACVAALFVAAPAQADSQIIKQTLDFDTEIANCETGEIVPYTQTISIIAKTDGVDENGEPVIVWARADFDNEVAIGPVSGDRYLIQTKTHSNQDPEDGSRPATLIAQIHWIDTGSGADFMVGESFHTTVGKDGEFIVSHQSANVRCGDFHDHLNVKLA